MKPSYIKSVNFKCQVEPFAYTHCGSYFLFANLYLCNNLSYEYPFIAHRW